MPFDDTADVPIARRNVYKGTTPAQRRRRRSKVVAHCKPEGIYDNATVAPAFGFDDLAVFNDANFNWTSDASLCEISPPAPYCPTNESSVNSISREVNDMMLDISPHVSRFVASWLNVNMGQMDDEEQVCVPTSGCRLPAGQVWESLFGTYIFPHFGPTSGGTWGEVKQMLLVIQTELPHLYRVHCWINKLLVLNKNRATKKEVAFIPRPTSRAVSILRCWNEWAKTMRAGDELRRCTCSNDFAFAEVSAALNEGMTWGHMRQSMLDIQRRLHSIDLDKYCA